MENRLPGFRRVGCKAAGQAHGMSRARAGARVTAWVCGLGGRENVIAFNAHSDL